MGWKSTYHGRNKGARPSVSDTPRSLDGKERGYGVKGKLRNIGALAMHEKTVYTISQRVACPKDTRCSVALSFPTMSRRDGH